MNELTTLRWETDEGEGEGEAEENEAEAETETPTARDRDLTLKILNAEIAARSWLIDKTIQLKDFVTATALTNVQIVAAKRRFKLTGDEARFEEDNKNLRAQRTDAALGNATKEKKFWADRTVLAFIFGVIAATVLLLFAWGAALAEKEKVNWYNAYPQRLKEYQEQREALSAFLKYMEEVEAEKRLTADAQTAAPPFETAAPDAVPSL